MDNRPIDVCVAGHICLDIIPSINSREIAPATLYTPGSLIQVDCATLSLGGAVANTGISLHRLGANVRVFGKVGNDLLGRMVLDLLRDYDPSFPQQILVAPGEGTSYSIVLSLPDVDRCFLHFPGTNDTFEAADLSGSSWQDTRILHFGYPPLMPGVLADNGRCLANVFSQAQTAGALTSLDMAMPAGSSKHGNTNWRKWFMQVLPKVDLFMPSLDELLLMWDPGRYSHLVEKSGSENLARLVPVEQLSEIADELITTGTSLVMIKFGDRGLFLRTHPQISSLLQVRTAWQDFDWQAWDDWELLSPCWEVPVVGTNGAGDCTIAGFLMSLLRGCRPQEALRNATAVGACCVQSVDAVSRIPAWKRCFKGSQVGSSESRNTLR